MGIGNVLKRIGAGAIKTAGDFGKKITDRNQQYRDYRRNENLGTYQRIRRIDEGARNVGRTIVTQSNRLVQRSYGTGKSGRGVPFAIASGRRGFAGRYKTGRPKGPTGKYIIPGVGAVGVYQYRDWMKRQRALDRIRREQMMNNPQMQQQPQDYPSYQQEIQEHQLPQQPAQQMPPEAPQKPLGRLNLWDNSISMVGETNFVTQGFGMFTPFAKKDNGEDTII